MILQALYDYYQRKAADPESQIAPEGWEWKEIPYIILIDKDGKFVGIQDTREEDGTKKRAHSFLLPQSVKRTVGVSANLLWDNIDYAIGAKPVKRKYNEQKHKHFKQRIMSELAERKIPSIEALMKFLDNGPVEQIENSKFSDTWMKMLEDNPFIAFKIDGASSATICDDIKNKMSSNFSDDDLHGLCLISGEKNQPIARLHPAIKGVRKSKTTGAALVSFNLAPFNSYHKSQNYNAPISKSAAFAYTTALNMLLGKESKNKVTIADLTMVFWTQKRESSQFDLETSFPLFFTDDFDDPDKGIQAVKGLYKAIYSGALPQGKDRFFVLSLAAPTPARVSVRSFRHGTIYEFAQNIFRHFEDMDIIKNPKEPEYLSLYQILTSTAPKKELDKVIPNLTADVIASILDVKPYPQILMQQCIRRIRADREVTRARAAILKASINRYLRFYHQTEKEITMALDSTNTKPSYLLGRLFAVLEKIQEEATTNQNKTIRDRFFGAASTSPVTVFSQLLKLKNHHLAKLENPGRRIFFEKLIGEIVANLSEFPSHLAFSEQAYFSIGYYHQRQEFFTSRKNENESAQS